MVDRQKTPLCLQLHRATRAAATTLHDELMTAELPPDVRAQIVGTTTTIIDIIIQLMTTFLDKMLDQKNDDTMPAPPPAPTS
jgi:hypothetical protein